MNLTPMKTLFITASLLIAVSLDAQNQGNIWYFGEGVGLDFNSGSPEVLTDGQVFGNPVLMGDFLYSEGSSVVSDNLGNLLFYSNGEKVWNRDHEVMPNGDGLLGMYSSTTAALIVPVPESDSLFLVFTTDGLERDLENGLRYSVVNMCLDSGRGDVILEQKNLPLLDAATEKLAAVRHANGKDVWLIAHEHGTDAFYVYAITPDGIDSTLIFNIGSVHEGAGFYSAIGQMKVSSDGSRLALVFSNVFPAVAEVFDFDRSTGVISNPVSLETNNGEYGLEFSPDGTKLYMQNFSGIFQFDVAAGTEAEINASKVNISPSSCTPGGIQLGPDGKIYIIRCSSNIAVIEFPNESGSDCGLIEAGIDVSPLQAIASLPSFIAGFNYTNKLPQCYEPQVEEEEEEEEEETGDTTTTAMNDWGSLQAWTVSPNPASDFFQLKGPALQHAEVQLFNSLGVQVLEMRIQELPAQSIPIGNLSPGIYFCRIMDAGKMVGVTRLIIN
ncbi:MAG: hypothetical protein ABR95_08885 [Sphingobacteriales bacterium BACL12 MAG-120813-bin55]|jgi:hypothetical protein|nr:MAG: hypothetical protein ABR95_08885 [Sphingobacteriales bacterium BACL12 MAG-120813-bin55]